MARKKRHEEHENHERWLISYADFITLLFAFFVVMYSISSVNEGKYRVVSRSLITAFGTPVRSLAPIQAGELVRAQQQMPVNNAISAIPMFSPRPLDAPGEEGEDGESRPPLKAPPVEAMAEAEMEEIADEINEALEPLIQKEAVAIAHYKDRMEVEIQSSVLFDSGSSELNQTAIPILESVAGRLVSIGNDIRVEGFTDNIPIKTSVFPSNWELAAVRAARVVRHLEEMGISPRRLVSVGYGEHRPIASNDTPEGRAKNRRVVLVVMISPVGPEPGLDPENLENALPTEDDVLTAQLTL